MDNNRASKTISWSTLNEDLSFVDELPKHVEIECPVCLQVMLNDPHQVSCCGCRFCAPCIERVKNGPCPLCKADEYNTMIDKERLRIINGLQVYCTNKEKGCQWKGDLKNLSVHLSKGNREGQCQFENVKCRYEKCQEIKQRHYLDDHEKNECPHRPYKCQYCTVNETYLSITKEHYEVCTHFLMSCPNEMCGIKFSRSNLGSHLSKECPLQPVECPFSWAGCTDKPLRKDSHSHTTDLKHMSLLAVACGQLNITCNNLKKENEDLAETCVQLKKETEQFTVVNKKLTADYEQIKQENELLSVTCGQLKVENEKILTDCTQLQEENEKIKRHISVTDPSPLLPITLSQTMQVGYNAGSMSHAYTHLFGHRISVKFTRLDLFGRGHVHLAFHEGIFDDLLPKLPKIMIIDDYNGTVIPLLQDTQEKYEKLDENILKTDCRAKGVITAQVRLTYRLIVKINIVASWD